MGCAETHTDNECPTTDRLWKGEELRTASPFSPRTPWRSVSEKKAGGSLDKDEKETVVRMNQGRLVPECEVGHQEPWASFGEELTTAYLGSLGGLTTEKLGTSTKRLLKGSLQVGYFD